MSRKSSHRALNTLFLGRWPSLRGSLSDFPYVPICIETPYHPSSMECGARPGLGRLTAITDNPADVRLLQKTRNRLEHEDDDLDEAPSEPGEAIA